VLAGDVAQLRQEVGRQGHLAPGGAGGLDQHGSHVVARFQHLSDAARVVGGQHDRLLDEAGGDARGHAAVEVRHGAGCDAVVPAVEVADEADHLGLAGEGAGEAQGKVRGLGARRREAHALCAGDEAVDELGPAHLDLVRGTPVGAERGLLAHRGDDRGMAVAEQQRAVAAEEIHVLVAVDVPLARAGSASGIDRVGQQRAAVVGEAGGDHLAGPLVKLGGASRAGPVLGLDLRVRSRH
jgi:hypothetical protein